LVILGDFNLPLELTRECHNNNEAELERARSVVECLETKGLVDCWKVNDDRYTYKTSSSRLDRIMHRFHVQYAENLETNWTFMNSDHCLLKLSMHSIKERPKNMRVVSLPTYLLDNEEAVGLIRDKMTTMSSECLDHWEPRVHLEYLKMCLRTSTGEVMKMLNKRVNAELDEIQKNISWRMGRMKNIPLYAYEENFSQLELLFTKRNLILDERSKNLAEKAKTKWFHEGEKANKYFLNLLNKRRGNTDIEKLVTERGEITDDNDINAEITNFYKNLYERGEPADEVIDDSFYEHITKVQNYDVIKVISPLSKDELYEVLLTCKDSAPGPDGIPYSYYKHFWYFFGDTLTQAWADSINNGILPASHNDSILRLLPKVGKDLTKLANWRPITLSNCDHKLITKCLARRLTNALKPCLHPNQTAYLPGKQIQDNLRVINIVNESKPNSLIVSLDAKKAFDSVGHDYIRRTLTEFGLTEFVPIFNLLYNQQKVNISANGRMLDGYKIKNGVKQGDSLSCILFIMCMDPLIRNIEANNNIERVDIDAIPVPKVVAYADDITCIVERSLENLQGIFTEYERLSGASGLVLNADKTEILDENEDQYRIMYINEEHYLQGVKKVKINGITFDKDQRQMVEENYNTLVSKIENMLTGWKARNLSLLGKILIYKTFGLSQVIYVLSIISLTERHYKKLDTIFNNFLWGRELNGETTRSRISKERLRVPIEYGGFGMISYERVLGGIYCRQLVKMYDEAFSHPLKSMITKNDTRFATGKSLTNLADDMAIKAHNMLGKLTLSYAKQLTNRQITEDVILINQLGAMDMGHMIKPRWINSNEATRLVHILGCSNMKNILDSGRAAVRLSKKVIKAPYLRFIKVLWQANIRCEVLESDKLRTIKGNYKQIHLIKSKEFRELIAGRLKLNPPKIQIALDVQDDLDKYAMKSYFNMIKRLANTRHKNTLLRIWNGDCLSYTRLIHLGITNTNTCPNCTMVDTPLHVLTECIVARQIWSKLMNKMPKNTNIGLMEYALGIYDGKIDLSIKAETLKMLMHFRELDSQEIYVKLKNYFLTVHAKNIRVRAIFGP